MGCGVDAAGKTRGNDEAFKPELGGELPGELLSNGRTLRAPTMAMIGPSASSSLPLA
jgi:hypothetical protein